MTSLTLSEFDPTKVLELGSSVEDTVAILNPLRKLMTTVPNADVDVFLLSQVKNYHPEIGLEIDNAQKFVNAVNGQPFDKGKVVFDFQEFLDYLDTEDRDNCIDLLDSDLTVTQLVLEVIRRINAR